MLNRSASLAMSTSVLKALPGKHDIKRHLVFSIFKQIVVTETIRTIIGTLKSLQQANILANVKASKFLAKNVKQMDEIEDLT